MLNLIITSLFVIITSLWSSTVFIAEHQYGVAVFMIVVAIMVMVYCIHDVIDRYKAIRMAQLSEYTHEYSLLGHGKEVQSNYTID